MILLLGLVVLENPYTSNFFLFRLLYILLPIPPETPNIKATFLPTNLSAFYGALIICFLSGMHWKSLIQAKKIELLVIPMIPVIFLWITFFFSNKLFFQFTVIFGLLWCLVSDLTLLKKLNEKWFKKMRVLITIFAIIPLTLNFFYQ